MEASDIVKKIADSAFSEKDMEDWKKDVYSALERTGDFSGKETESLKQIGLLDEVDVRRYFEAVASNGGYPLNRGNDFMLALHQNAKEKLDEMFKKKEGSKTFTVGKDGKWKNTIN